jgi:hypothetical protein
MSIWTRRISELDNARSLLHRDSRSSENKTSFARSSFEAPATAQFSPPVSDQSERFNCPGLDRQVPGDCLDTTCTFLRLLLLCYLLVVVSNNSHTGTTCLARLSCLCSPTTLLNIPERVETIKRGGRNTELVSADPLRSSILHSAPSLTFSFGQDTVTSVVPLYLLIKA